MTVQRLKTIQDAVIITTEQEQESVESPVLKNRSFYQHNLDRLKSIYHSQCLFKRQPLLIPDLVFQFDDSGILHGQFNCDEHLQGYDNKVHGGVIAAVIDASMAQCLMGHGVAGVTTELSVKYRKPVFIRQPVTLTTQVKELNCGMLYTMKCEIVQNHNLVVQGIGKFYKTNK